jgi:twitching motility two-component system response regulator PilH
MDGEEALLRLRDGLFDLIILDVVMPKKNGYQLCRELKTTPQYSNIPIIMMTTKNQDFDKFWGMRQGADEYLTKPCSEEDLLRAVNKYLPAQMAAEPRAQFVSEPVHIIPSQPASAKPIEPIVQEKREEIEMIPMGTTVSPISQGLKESTGEHSAFPGADPKKKIVPLKDKVQNSFYRFNN